jgi:hypothetical protein
MKSAWRMDTGKRPVWASERAQVGLASGRGEEGRRREEGRGEEDDQ